MKNFDIYIEAKNTNLHYWRDIWKYRELFFILAWRDIAVRYKQTILGFIWTILRPLLTMSIFVIIFGKIAKISIDADTSYSIFVFSALIPWFFFSTALSDASNSMILSSNLISKVYFPRMIIPSAAIIVACVDFLISLLILAILLIIFSHPLTLKILTLPLFSILLFILAWSLGLFLAALNVKYLDFKFIIPFALQIGLYVSPIGFPTTIIPDEWKMLFYLNPLVGIIDGFRWAIIGRGLEINYIAIAISILECIIISTLSIKYFRSIERSIADTI